MVRVLQQASERPPGRQRASGEQARNGVIQTSRNSPLVAFSQSKTPRGRDIPVGAEAIPQELNSFDAGNEN